jgi:hypothetical protein
MTAVSVSELNHKLFALIDAKSVPLTLTADLASFDMISSKDGRHAAPLDRKNFPSGAMIVAHTEYRHLAAAHTITTEETRSTLIELPQLWLRLAEEQDVPLQRAAGEPQTTRGVR